MPGPRVPPKGPWTRRPALLSPVIGQAAAWGPPPPPPDWSAVRNLLTLLPAPARTSRGRPGLRGSGPRPLVTAGNWRQRAAISGFGEVGGVRSGTWSRRRFGHRLQSLSCARCCLDHAAGARRLLLPSPAAGERLRGERGGAERVREEQRRCRRCRSRPGTVGAGGRPGRSCGPGPRELAPARSRRPGGARSR